MLWQNYSSSTPVNISSGEELPIKEIIKNCDIVDSDFNKVDFDKTKPNGILKNTRHIFNESLNDYKFTKLKDGPTELFWFKENKDNLRIDEKMKKLIITHGFLILLVKAHQRTNNIN